MSKEQKKCCKKCGGSYTGDFAGKGRTCHCDVENKECCLDYCKYGVCHTGVHGTSSLMCSSLCDCIHHTEPKLPECNQELTIEKGLYTYCKLPKNHKGICDPSPKKEEPKECEHSKLWYQNYSEPFECSVCTKEPKEWESELKRQCEIRNLPYRDVKYLVDKAKQEAKEAYKMDIATLKSVIEGQKEILPFLLNERKQEVISLCLEKIEGMKYTTRTQMSNDRNRILQEVLDEIKGI